jgi:hypothetical protein
MTVILRHICPPPPPKKIVERLKPKTTKKVQAVPAAQSPSDEFNSELISVSENNESLPCGFCGLKYFGEKSVLKVEWIRCEKRETWFHDVCVGVQGRKQLSCGRCMKNYGATQGVPSVIRVASNFFNNLIKLVLWGVESNWVHSALRPPIGLLCQPRVIMMMEILVE